MKIPKKKDIEWLMKMLRPTCPECGKYHNNWKTPIYYVAIFIPLTFMSKEDIFNTVREDLRGK